MLQSVSSSKSVHAKREAVQYGIIIMQFIYGLVTALGVELTGPSLCIDQEDHWIITTSIDTYKTLDFQAAHSLRAKTLH